MTPEIQLKILEIGVGGAIILFVIAMAGIIIRMMVRHNAFITLVLDKFNESLDKRDAAELKRLEQVTANSHEQRNYDREQREQDRQILRDITTGLVGSTRAIDCLDKTITTHDKAVHEKLDDIVEKLEKPPRKAAARG